MKVLGIDPGSLTTGYGVVGKGAGASLVHIADGQVELGQSSPLPERLLAISRAICAVIEETRPDAVAIESVFFSRNARSAITLGEARGVLLLSAASYGVPVYEYAPTSVKLAVTGYGNATKEQVQKMVRMLLKTGAEHGSDAADALAIAICHINSFRQNAARPGPAAAGRRGAKRTFSV